MAPSSAVWGYFKMKPMDPGKVVCQECQKDLTYKNSTSNLFDHLLLIHKISLPKLPAKGGKRKRYNIVPPESDANDPDDPSTANQPEKRQRLNDNDVTTHTSNNGPLNKCLNSMYAFKPGQSRDIQCTNALAFMIVKDNLPLCTSEKEGFKVFSKTLQPLYKVPSERIVTSYLDDKYTLLKSRFSKMMAGADHICLTVDLWTNKYTMNGHLGVSAHITTGPQTDSVELGCMPMLERKTIENLKNALHEFCAVVWKIDYDKVRAVITDGGGNVKGAVKAEFGEGKHVPCVAHRLNLIGQKAIGNIAYAFVPSEVDVPPPELPDDEDEVEGVVEPEPEVGTIRSALFKVKRTARFFKKSEVATARLIEIQMQEQGKSESTCLRLIQECPTRWNTGHDMIERYLLLAPLVNRVILELQRNRGSRAKPPPIISAEEEEVLREVRDLLLPLARATKEMCFEKTVTLSKSIPVVNSLRYDIEKNHPESNIGKTLKSHLLALLKDNFGKIEEVPMFAAATLLDPRFKKYGFYQNDSTPCRVANAMSFVGDLIKKRMNEVQAQEQTERAEEHDSGGEDEFWSHFDRDVARQSALHSGQDTAGGASIELRMFLNSPVMKRKENPDPLLAWESLKNEYKYLYAVAQQFLSILGTSVPAERLFSHAGMIANQKRTRLSSKRLDRLIFLRSCSSKLWFD